MTYPDPAGAGGELVITSLPPARALTLASATASFQLETGRWIVTGLVVHNSGATTGIVQLHDGGDATGPVIASVNPATSGVDRDRIGTPGVVAESGLWVEVGAGVACDGSVYAIRL